MLTKNGTRSLVWSVALLTALGAAQVSAALVVTNGDFSAAYNWTNGDGGDDPGDPNNNARIFQWFDVDTGGPAGYFLDVWQSRDGNANDAGDAPQTEPRIVFSGDAGAQNFLYQAIGTKEANDLTLNFSISLGNPGDGTGLQTGTLQTSLFQSNGVFTGVQGTDIVGQPGITQIGSTVINAVSLGGVDPVSAYEIGSISLAGANLTDTLFLRFKWTKGANGGGYINGDNITISVTQAAVVPEPSTLALLGLGAFGLVGFAMRKKYRGKKIH